MIIVNNPENEIKISDEENYEIHKNPNDFVILNFENFHDNNYNGIYEFEDFSYPQTLKCGLTLSNPNKNILNIKNFLNEYSIVAIIKINRLFSIIEKEFKIFIKNNKKFVMEYRKIIINLIKEFGLINKNSPPQSSFI